MPTATQPIIRALQEALESDGLIQTRDSTLVTIYKAAESGGSRIKVVPKDTVYIRSTVYTPV